VDEICLFKIAKHSWDEDHTIQWDKTEIMHKEYKRIFRMLEVSVLIRTNEEAISQVSLDVISIWLPLLLYRK
jgi:hypothetical protein